MPKSLYLYLEICIHTGNTNHSIYKFVKQVGENDRLWLVSIKMFFRFPCYDRSIHLQIHVSVAFSLQNCLFLTASYPVQIYVYWYI